MNRARLSLLLCFAVIAGCATVPKEVVELSYNLGNDLQGVRESYKTLVHEQFENFRVERLNYFENEWKPRLVKDWVDRGRLVDVASGKAVWSRRDKTFVSPGTDGADDLLGSVNSWASAAVKKLDKKKQELLDPINQGEADMMASVDQVFDQLTRENSTITAHLNSLRKVQEVQDEIAADLKMKDARTRLSSLLDKASQDASGGLDAIRKADEAIQKVKDHIPSKGEQDGSAK